MPRRPRRPDAELLGQARHQALSTGGLRRVFPLTLEEWVARAPSDAIAGVIRALLAVLPRTRRIVFEERLREVMVRTFSEEKIPPGSRRITPSLAVEIVFTPATTEAGPRAYQVMRHGVGKIYGCDPLTVLTHQGGTTEFSYT
jgi:hypothetical protein